jgi:stress response protein YsnF
MSSLDPMKLDSIQTENRGVEKPVEDVVFSLLSERLMIDRYKRKIGEIVVRKEIVTETVEVLIRREKLIVEQISPEFRQLAVVDLGESHHKALEHSEIKREFANLSEAHGFLDLIASQPSLDVKAIQINIEIKPSVD